MRHWTQQSNLSKGWSVGSQQSNLSTGWIRKKMNMRETISPTKVMNSNNKEKKKVI